MARGGDSVEKAKVRSAVEWYRTTHKAEYEAFCLQMKDKRALATNEFAQLEGSPHRALHEIPETMFDKLVLSLEPGELQWFSTNKANQWFAKTFPEFAVATSI